MDEVQKFRGQRRDEPEAVAGSPSTRVQYSLRFDELPTVGQLVAIAVATAVYTVMSWFCATFLTGTVPVVSSVFFAIGFGIPFALWFGGWALVIAYIGNAIGAGVMAGQPLPNSLLFGTVDLIQLGIPMLLYRLLAPQFGLDSIGKDVFTAKGFIFFLLCAVIPNNIIGGLYGNYLLMTFGLVPPNVFLLSWVQWAASNIVLTAVIGSVLLRYLGPVVERFGLTVHGALS
jgi:hypothetical protein